VVFCPLLSPPLCITPYLLALSVSYVSLCLCACACVVVSAWVPVVCAPSYTLDCVPFLTRKFLTDMYVYVCYVCVLLYLYMYIYY